MGIVYLMLGFLGLGLSIHVLQHKLEKEPKIQQNERSKLSKFVCCHDEAITWCSATSTAVGMLLVIILAFGVSAAWIDWHQDKIEVEETRAQLVYRIETGMCGFESCVVDDIEKFNKVVRKQQYVLTDSWYSVLCNPFWGDIMPLEYSSIDVAKHTQHSQSIRIKTDK